MTGSPPAIALVIGIFALLLGGAAQAQEDLSAGKTPAQLFRLDCAICHKTPQGLSKAGGLFGLEGFLAQHYTASGETAAAIAAYLKSVDSAARTSAPQPSGRHPNRNAAKPHKPGTKTGTKTGAKTGTKTGTAKSAEPKAGAPKTDAAAGATGEKPADEKTAKPKSAKNKPASHASEATREKPKGEKKKTD